MKTKSFRRFLSSAAAVAVLASASALYVSADADNGALHVTPFTGTIVANNATYVSAEEVTPFDNGLKASKITLMEGKEAIDHSPDVWGGWGDRAQLFMPNDSAPLTGSTGLVF